MTTTLTLIGHLIGWIALTIFSILCIGVGGGFIFRGFRLMWEERRGKATHAVTTRGYSVPAGLLGYFQVVAGAMVLMLPVTLWWNLLRQLLS